MQRFATRFQGKEFRTAPRIGVARSPLCKRKGVSYRRQLGKILNLPDFLKMVFKLLHGLSPICAAADQRVGLDLSRIDRRVSRFDRSIRDTSPPRIPNRPPSCSVWLLRVARGDTQRQIRPGPTSAPIISALFAASNVFDRTLMPTVVGLGRGRTSTCSMTSFAIHVCPALLQAWNCHRA